jgi:TRAP-type C4-dicarboxylate transport system permease small subunit
VERLYTLADRASQAATWFGGGLLLLSAAIITIDVFARKLFHVSLGGSDELAGYTLAISTSWGLSFALMRRANIRIDALYMRLPQRLGAWLDLLALVSMGVFMAFVSWFASQLLRTSIEMGASANTPLQTPLVIPQALWVAGFILFMLVLLVVLARTIGLLLQGDMRGVGRIAGIRTVQEEVRDEVSAEVGRQLMGGDKKNAD